MVFSYRLLRLVLLLFLSLLEASFPHCCAFAHLRPCACVHVFFFVLFCLFIF